MQLATIGYENDTLDSFLGRLTAAGVQKVIDVRAVASSRKAGFSKSLLAASLAERGIGYVHLRDLGTPKAGRQAARAGNVTAMHAIYEQQLALPQAQLQLIQAGEIAQAEKSALLCYEADVCGCHRKIVAERLQQTLGFTIENI
jgi:uncharacterized protein (DUF488 family)